MIHTAAAVGMLLCLVAIPLALAATPLEAIDAYNKGVDLAVEGKFPEALAAIDTALAIDSNFSLAWTTRSGISNAMGNFNESLVAADRAISLSPNQSEAWTNRASALINLGRDEEGLESANRAIEIDPRLSEAWIDRATALSNLGRMDEANESLQMAGFLIGGTAPATASPSPSPTPAATRAPITWAAPVGGLLALAFILRMKRA